MIFNLSKDCSAKKAPLWALSPILGSWIFSAMIVGGQERPPFNPDLKLCFEFNSEQVSHLLYFRTNEKGFCERWGEYSYDGNKLHDKVVKLNPGNRSECGMDTDMRLGTETYTPVTIAPDGRLFMEIPVGDDKIYYIYHQAEKCPSFEELQAQ